jgi:hypothetical protein
MNPGEPKTQGADEQDEGDYGPAVGSRYQQSNRAGDGRQEESNPASVLPSRECLVRFEHTGFLSYY